MKVPSEAAVRKALMDCDPEVRAVVRELFPDVRRFNPGSKVWQDGKEYLIVGYAKDCEWADAYARALFKLNTSVLDVVIMVCLTKRTREEDEPRKTLRLCYTTARNLEDATPGEEATLCEAYKGGG